ncbi:hypothetical protein SAY87_025226 [Trapa incisa]|uniref:CBS domain-containing protein n=1 Tax=Trapa incisa TaxID=236973 RepID=A0AAN7JGK0_9MYRT|nr:hypothetical protein SAY87_025226 [Trapa incisa]
MASVFLYHVVGDLTVGKPELVEFLETDTVESAIRAIGESTEGGIPVWKRASHLGIPESSQMRQQRFVGILDSVDIVTFLSRSECLQDQDRAMKTPVSEVVFPNNTLLRLVDPGTRLIDALEMMKQGVKRLLVAKSVGWKGMSKRFSILYNGKWLKNVDNSNSSNNNIPPNTSRPSSSNSTVAASALQDKFCCLSREDVIRFIIGCLGALAPLPLSSISSLEAINTNYISMEASLPATEVTRKRPEEPRAVAVVEPTSDGQYKIIGEISASKLWKCDYMAAAWALANLSAGQFVMGVEDNMSLRVLPEFQVSPTAAASNGAVGGAGGGAVGPISRPKKFSSRSIGFFNNRSPSLNLSRSMYRGRSAPLTCKVSSSLAAVMAQMLSHRATHVWVTDAENEEVLVGVVAYVDILAAVTKLPPLSVPQNKSTETLMTTEVQS